MVGRLSWVPTNGFGELQGVESFISFKDCFGLDTSCVFQVKEHWILTFKDGQAKTLNHKLRQIWFLIFQEI